MDSESMKVSTRGDRILMPPLYYVIRVSYGHGALICFENDSYSMMLITIEFAIIFFCYLKYAILQS